MIGMSKLEHKQIQKRAISINEFCKAYSIGRTSAYDEIKVGRLRVVKFGRRTLVPIDNAEKWLESLSKR